MSMSEELNWDSAPRAPWEGSQLRSHALIAGRQKPFEIIAFKRDEA